MAEVFGPCAADAHTANDATCLRTFVRAFAGRAFRRPPAEDDVQFLARAADPLPLTRDGLARVVALVVNAPEFFYAPEHGREGDDGAVVPMDPYELAARLAYHFWDAPPDQALLEAARTGALLDADGLEQQAPRGSRATRAPTGPSRTSSRTGSGCATRRRPNFIAFLSQHGGVFGANMYPADATLTDTAMAAEGHHQVRRGRLALASAGGTASLSPVLASPSSSAGSARRP